MIVRRSLNLMKLSRRSLKRGQEWFRRNRSMVCLRFPCLWFYQALRHIIKPWSVAMTVEIYLIILNYNCRLRSVSTLQTARAIGPMGSKFHWQIKYQCQRTHSKRISWSDTYKANTTNQSSSNGFESRRFVLGDRHDSPLVWFVQVRVIGCCVIVRELDLICPGWRKFCGREFQRSKCKFPLTPKSWNSPASVG